MFVINLTTSKISGSQERPRPVREFISELRGVSDTAKWANIFDKIGLAGAPLENLCADGNFDAARNRSTAGRPSKPA